MINPLMCDLVIWSALINEMWHDTGKFHGHFKNVISILKFVTTTYSS